jgi:flagellar hook-length control protein FliK
MGKKEQQFGTVMNEKQQPGQQHESKSVDRQPETAEGSGAKQVIAHNRKAEMKQEKIERKELANKVGAEKNIQTKAEVDPQLQVKVQQLEPTELHGEQALAGVDLPALVTKLQSLNEDFSNEELLAQLVTQEEESFTDKSGLLENVELTAAMVAEPQPQNITSQNIIPVIAENPAPDWQISQKVLDSVVSQKSAVSETAIAVENVAVGVQPVEETLFLMEEAVEEIDPRFAGLLKPRTENCSVQQAQSAKEPVQLHNSKQQMELNQNESVAPVSPEEVVEQKQSDAVFQRLDGTAKQMMENLTHQAQRNLQPQGQPPVQGLEMNKAMPQTPVVQLANGYQVAESQIFDQVVTQISGSFNGESGRMVLRLQPAELGSLKLELIVEGNRIRANLHAQSHQVQEVLERNLPQLRNALTEQGLKIDQFQVNIDQRQQGGQFENLAQQQQHNDFAKQSSRRRNHEPEEQIVPLAHLMQKGGGGISLHV